MSHGSNILDQVSWESGTVSDTSSPLCKAHARHQQIESGF